MYTIPGMPAPGPRHLPATRRAVARQSAAWTPQATPVAEVPVQPAQHGYSDAERWWYYSRQSAQALLAGRRPPSVRVHGPVLEPGEVALLTAEVDYSRCYGGDARYERVPLLVAGKPAVMAGALAVQGVINHRRKIQAQRAAAVQWRDHEPVAVTVTTERLLCRTVSAGLVSLWYGACAEFYPDLENWSLTMGFDSTTPVRLTGPATAALSLWSAVGVLGDQWSRDPRLAPLLS